MDGTRLPVGSFVRLAKQDLQAVLDRLQTLGYRTIGPRVRDGAVVYDDVKLARDLPFGIIDQQDGGKYRLEQAERAGYFDYVVGPHSLKNFLFPPCETVLESSCSQGRWRFVSPPGKDDRPLAFLGPRACDLHALGVLDRVFLQGAYQDPLYRARRESLFIVAVNCRRAAATCFCHSMKSGPMLRTGFDLGLTELDPYFVVQIGTDRGGHAITAAGWTPCSLDDIQDARELSDQLATRMRHRSTQPRREGNGAPRDRYLDTSELHDLLLGNLEHPRWEQVAERCLACGNCTLVCPTCFCSYSEDRANLAGDRVRRERLWDSCFTAQHSYMNSGPVRRTTLARYRQWLTHKLATWHDQFGTSGCTGCGRCITWCPVGIDLTEEVAALRGEEP